MVAATVNQRLLYWKMNDEIIMIGNLQPENTWDGTIRQQNKVIHEDGICLAITAMHDRRQFNIMVLEDEHTTNASHMVEG